MVGGNQAQKKPTYHQPQLAARCVSVTPVDYLSGRDRTEDGDQRHAKQNQVPGRFHVRHQQPTAVCYSPSAGGFTQRGAPVASTDSNQHFLS